MAIFRFLLEIVSEFVMAVIEKMVTLVGMQVSDIGTRK